ncbi:MAG TPA: 2-oxo acid dehydrogenase [Sorangium sp.]|nr:2-oxo acid dehydrogenase [Sorangium sp.]
MRGTLLHMGMNSTRRKLAISSWSSPREGNIYGKLTLDASQALAYLEALRERSGEKITLTHFVGKAVAMALAASPGLNGYIRFGTFHHHDSVNITYLVALEGGSDLAKVKVDNADQKTLQAIAGELRAAASKVRGGKDADFEKAKGMIKMMPTFLLRPLLWFTGLFASSFGWEVKALGVTPFPFGSCIITSVGMFGLDEGYAPPTPFARVPLYVLIGALRDKPAAVDGEVVIRPELTLTATIDHRFMDGAQGAVLARVMRDIFNNPQQLDEIAQA